MTLAPENSDFFAGKTFLATISTLLVSYRVIHKKKSNKIDRGKHSLTDTYYIFQVYCVQ